MSEGVDVTRPILLPPDSGVTVRMYRPGGVGDCFLLAFRARDDTARYMLVDCGVLMATKGGSARMKKIAQNIAEVTDRHLHVLVATHEHWDHLSGFQYAKAIFDTIQIDEVWLAWTEDRSNPLANRLREKHAMAFRALTAAVAQLEMAADPDADAIKAVLGFQGEFDATLGISGTAAQMQYAHDRGAPPRYCRPGETPLSLPDVEGVRLFVFGPPEDETLLSRSDPSGSDSEVYERAFALDEETAFFVATLAAEAPDALPIDQRVQWNNSRPFEETHSIPLDEAPEHEYFLKHYGFGPSHEGHGPEWRRIDTDWLRAAGSLALKLDNDTNNTSLAFAIELKESGKVLLFAADAQVGNWLSWHKLSWRQEGSEDNSVVTGGDLVRRTVFYKVGHHGSHNATLREKGLQMMESPDLVAMIPVDEEQAAKQGKEGWSMPFPPLAERLREKTRGRIIRTDTGVPSRPDDVSPREWEDFLNSIAEDPGPDKLWIQYTVSA